jgi:hypothetical protein
MPVIIGKTVFNRFNNFIYQTQETKILLTFSPLTQFTLLLPILYTDPNCALCRSFSKKIKAKISDRLELKEIKQGEELKYVTQGQEFLGIKATQKLISDFPELQEFVWLLPSSLREEALLKGYKWSNFLRNLLFKKPCNTCPKK